MVYLGSACVGMPFAALLSAHFGMFVTTLIAVVAGPLGYLLIYALTNGSIHAYVPLLYLAVLVLGFSTGCSFIALMGLMFQRASSPQMMLIFNGTTNFFYAVGVCFWLLLCLLLCVVLCERYCLGGMFISIAFNNKWFGAFDSTILVLMAMHAVYAPVVLAAVWYVTRQPEDEEQPLLPKAADETAVPAPSASETRLLSGKEATRVLVCLLFVVVCCVYWLKLVCVVSQQRFLVGVRAVFSHRGGRLVVHC